MCICSRVRTYVVHEVSRLNTAVALLFLSLVLHRMVVGMVVRMVVRMARIQHNGTVNNNHHTTTLERPQKRTRSRPMLPVVPMKASDTMLSLITSSTRESESSVTVAGT